MQDINAISYAWTPEAAVILKNLFFLKWEGHANPQVRDAAAHFKTEWCNERVGIWSSGHSRNSVMNTNGLEATNKVIKDELTFRQLMPVLDFLQKAPLWLREQSLRRDPGPEGARNPNVFKFALQHDFITVDWTEAYSWKLNTRKQVFFLPQLNVFVAAAPGALDRDRSPSFRRHFY